MSAPAVPIIDERIAYCTRCTWWDGFQQLAPANLSALVHLTHPGQRRRR
jgi:hypothetical protein